MSYAIPFEVPEWTFEEALGELHAALRFGIEPLLETVEDMLVELGDPDLAFVSLQVAGTNGKTSTSRYTAAILEAHGLHTALYTSPELVSYVERMEVGGRPISGEQFAHGIAAARVAGERVNAARRARGERPYDITEFDLLTVAACVVFAEAEVDVAVLEVGMGGRWDATTAIKSIGTVAVTGIGLDHTHILGETLEAIAAEKAAVIKPSMRCVLGSGVAAPTSVEEVFLERCKEVGVTPAILRPRHPEDASATVAACEFAHHPNLPLVSYWVERRPQGIAAPLCVGVETPGARYNLEALKPAYQAPNIALAVALCEAQLGRTLDPQALRDAVVSCPTPGRFDVVRAQPLALIDACHNPQSVEVFLEAVREVFPQKDERPALLCAVLADKDVAGIVELLAGEFPCVYTTQTHSHRALAAQELACEFGAQGVEVAGVFGEVAAALDALRDVAFCACGSITLAGEVAAILR